MAAPVAVSESVPDPAITAKAQPGGPAEEARLHLDWLPKNPTIEVFEQPEANLVFADGFERGGFCVWSFAGP